MYQWEGIRAIHYSDSAMLALRSMGIVCVLCRDGRFT